MGEESKCLVQNAREVMLSVQPYFNIVTDYRELLTGSLVICLLTEGAIQKSQSCSQEEEDKLNKENAERESSVLLQMNPAKFHTEGPEEKGESLALENYYKYRRSSVQKSFATEKQQEEDGVDDACQRITGQEKESESPADGERREEHQVCGDERQEEKENEGEGNADKSAKEVKQPPAPSQNEDEAGQSHDQEAAEGR